MGWLRLGGRGCVQVFVHVVVVCVSFKVFVVAEALAG